MQEIMRFPTAKDREPDIDLWLSERNPVLGDLAREWFTAMRRCGSDVRELMHDGCPMACVQDVAFGYVAVFTGHVNVGFYQGAALPDPAGLLLGSGKRMRHVKLQAGAPVNAKALGELIAAAYHEARKYAAR